MVINPRFKVGDSALFVSAPKGESLEKKVISQFDEEVMVTVIDLLFDEKDNFSGEYIIKFSDGKKLSGVTDGQLKRVG